MADVLEINDVDELASYRLLWNSLLPATPRATFFHTFDWLDIYWRHFGHNQKLRVLVVRSAGKSIGIVPLCVRTERHHFGDVRVLTYPLDDWGMWYGPIGPHQATVMLLAMQHIRHTTRDWDMIELRWVGPGISDGGRPARAMQVVGMFSERQPYQTSSVVDLAGGWDDYLAGKPPKHRHEFRRALRRVFLDHDAQYIRHRPAPASAGDGDPRWDLYAMCQHVAMASWQAKSTTGNTLTHERVRRFLEDAHTAAARLGMLDMNLLLIDDRPVAFNYNYHNEGHVYGLRAGFDGTVEYDNLGNALILKLIKDSCQRGDRSFDLGAGEWNFKRRFRTRAETSYRLSYTPALSWRSQGVRLARWAARWRQEPEGAIKKPSA